MAFPEGFLQELKMRNDITEVVSPYVNLKRRGRNMVGLCPFHGEKTPSFNIYTETDSFYCFGCGASGDVISFIMFRPEKNSYIPHRPRVLQLSRPCSILHCPHRGFPLKLL